MSDSLGPISSLTTFVMKKASAAALVSALQTKQLSRGAADSLDVRSFSTRPAAAGTKVRWM